MWDASYTVRCISCVKISVAVANNERKILKKLTSYTIFIFDTNVIKIILLDRDNEKQDKKAIYEA